MSTMLHPLRAEAEALCAGIRRDRGEGLYIARGMLPASRLFVCESRGDWIVLRPGPGGILAFSAWLDAPEVFGFGPFSGRSWARADMTLFCQGVKLLETDCPSPDALLYARAVRRRAAALLRQHSAEGGAIPLCMRIAQTLLLRVNVSEFPSLLPDTTAGLPQCGPKNP